MTDNERKPRRKITREVATTLLDIVGGLAVMAGVAAVYWPAALILGGALLLVVSWRWSQ
jgi:hypothetical protein